ncbi:MAG TPA: hypothetical protein PKC48_02255 [Sphingorhabdus sp.]|uniref:hypothetical protein n=1 Tax=Sphingorhabdus sp. TaxID=1902408 RepID=UPI002CE41E6B|nr:hypothetical protein [Sphingorhabdus sp.]HMT41560.1 hypothetical protein [Sphingorhabdus sp.]HMU21077.1 hypothetical protein [Sphingorhabdus sp.]
MARRLHAKSAWNKLAPLGALSLLALGCSGEAASDNGVIDDLRDKPAASAAIVPRVHAQENADTAITESDRLSLQTADAACKRGDPNAFFDAFIQSKAVQKKYTAPAIEYVLLRPDFTVNRWEEIKAADYADFPMMMVDYYRKSTRPVRAGDDEHVVIELNQGQNEAFVVEWTRVIYDGKSDGGDDLGTAFTLDGQPYRKGESGTDGSLFFETANGCWQLSTDTRHHRSYAAK